MKIIPTIESVIRDSQGRAYTIETSWNDVWQQYDAVEENYDGPEDHYRARSGATREEAVEALIESLEEYSDHWQVPNELDHAMVRRYDFISAYSCIAVLSYNAISLDDVSEQVFMETGSHIAFERLRLIGITKP